MSLAKFFASVGCVFAKNLVQKELKFWLRKREYPEGRKSSAMRKVRFYNLKIKNNDNDNNMKGIQLVVTYHPLLKSLSAIINMKLILLHMDNVVKRVFTPQPTIVIVN